MKDIKDYLHLYLGCDCQYDEFVTRLGNVELRLGRLYGLRDNMVFIATTWGKFNCMSSRVKPILRPLSDMTEEEIKDKGRYNPIQNEHTTYSPESFLYLLSKSFDLFNLIPEGLAIDKTTLK